MTEYLLRHVQQAHAWAGCSEVACSIRIIYSGTGGTFTIPCLDLQFAEYFAFEYAKMHPDAECIEIYDDDDCIGLVRPSDALRADPTVHIGEYDTQRDPRVQEKLDRALMVRKDMLDLFRDLEQKPKNRRRTNT